MDKLWILEYKFYGVTQILGGYNFMDILTRLKLELNNKEYFTDVEYQQLLTENGLTGNVTYVKATHELALLRTARDVLEKVANDSDLMANVYGDLQTFQIGGGYQNLVKQINRLNDRIRILEIRAEDSDANEGILLFGTRI